MPKSDLDAAVRDFARRQELPVAEARRMLTSLGVLVARSEDHSDAAVVEAFLHGVRYWQHRMIELVGAQGAALDSVDLAEVVPLRPALSLVPAGAVR